MNTEDIVRSWAQRWNAGDAAGMTELFTVDCSYRDRAFQTHFTGLEGVAEWMRITQSHIPDLHIELHAAFGNERQAMARYTLSGTFGPDHPFDAGQEVAGSTFSVPAASCFTVREGRIHAVEDFYNLADVMRQLGLPAGPFTPRESRRSG
ncbi:hypothetical protein GCM10022403_046510 [Streptomyces coacervatus]|uniref:SnoaL-like domain-containing protein n=2 Tax=Streptomyces coacervatus TaxID=647381 RepID=A0ABP7I0W5_9ACTN